MADQYAGREQKFNDTLPAIVGNFMTAVSHADGLARKESVAITKEIMELPNIEISQKMTLLNSSDPIMYSRTLPAVTYAEPRPLLAESVTLSMSMTVSASTTEESSRETSSEASVSASAGYLFWSGSFSMKASVSTHSSHKRTSDYSATTDMELRMVRHPLPEGLAKTLDSMNEQAKAIDEINLAFARQKISEIANQDDAALPSGEEES